jgi:uncharacterized protein involved in response to NO
MIQGFEQCFVLGFLLTAMPAFTHSEKCRPWELAIAVGAMAVLGAAALMGAAAVAQAAFLAALVLIGVAGTRRIVGNPQKPPEEFVFVGFGLVLGLTGGALLLASALGAPAPLPARFAERLLSLGMVLSLVIGVGSLLVPTFAGMRDPLVIAGIAGPHQRRGRRALFACVMLGFALAFTAELIGYPRLGMGVRAGAAATMGLWVWKLGRLPRRDGPGFALWGSGWMIMAGLWIATLFPARALAGLHTTFIGGFALLTMGIGTRVVVSHGKHPLPLERRALSAWTIVLFAAALAFRVQAELLPATALTWLSASAAAWLLAWLLWSVRALPLVWRRG